MRFVLFILFPCLLFAKSTVPRTIASPTDYSGFEQAALLEFDDVRRSEFLKQSFITSQAEIKAAYDEYPWSVSATGQSAVNKSIPYYKNIFESTQSINYRNRNGLQASLSHSNQVASADLGDPKQDKDTLSLSLEQDLMHMNKNNPLWIKVNADKIGSQISYVSAEAEYLRKKLEFIDQITSFHVIRCQMKDYESIQNNIQEIIDTGKEQAATHTSSTKNYLSLLVLENSFRTKTQQLQNQEIDIKNRINSISDNMEILLKNYLQNATDCTNTKNMSFDNNNTPLNEDIADTLPEIFSLELQIKQQEQQTQITKTNQKPSISPFVAVNSTQSPYALYKGSDVMVGLKLSHDFDGGDDNLQLKSTQQKIKLLEQRIAFSKKELRSNIITLNQVMSNESQMYPIYKKNIENATQLLEVLKAQRAIGSVDVNSIGSSYLSYADSLRARHDSWRNVRSSTLKKIEYTSVSQRMKSNVSKLE